ncbi:unnamed protein product, partial [marine sediment metagenome]
MRIALIHDWLTGMRGGEKVLAELCKLMPQADLLTLIHVPGCCDATIEQMRIITSWLGDLPGVRHYYRYLLPAMPLAIERMDVDRYDLVISSSHCVAKGICRSPESVHLCYCHTPMRYAWSQQRTYRSAMGPTGLALEAAGRFLRAWDRRSASHVDGFIANSKNVLQRIWQAYGRRGDVVYPPIDTGFYTPGDCRREDFYLMVTALAPNKGVDQAIAAASKLSRPLRIIGSGPMAKRLRRIAPPNVTFMGWQSNEVVRDNYRRCRALLFPGQEDFGMVPLEAMACGTPVVAFASGGASETVLGADSQNPAGPTGVLYSPQSPDTLAQAIIHFEGIEGGFDP